MPPLRAEEAAVDCHRSAVAAEASPAAEAEVDRAAAEAAALILQKNIHESCFYFSIRLVHFCYSNLLSTDGYALNNKFPFKVQKNKAYFEVNLNVT